MYSKTNGIFILRFTQDNLNIKIGEMSMTNIQNSIYTIKTIIHIMIPIYCIVHP